MRIGLISDTHGLLRPSAIAALHGVDLIFHAGDVGGRRVLAELRRIAPVRAVRGNVDDPHDPDLEAAIDTDVAGTRIHVSHGHELGSPTPAKLLERHIADIIVYGHTHKADVHRAGRRIVVNPGAAGPARFRLKPSLALLTVGGGSPDVRLVELP